MAQGKSRAVLVSLLDALGASCSGGSGAQRDLCQGQSFAGLGVNPVGCHLQRVLSRVRKLDLADRTGRDLPEGSQGSGLALVFGLAARYQCKV